MRTFQVYRHPDGKVKVVKTGYSWPAFLLGGLWTLSKRLWSLTLLFIVINFIFIYVVPSIIEFYLGCDYPYLIGWQGFGILLTPVQLVYYIGISSILCFFTLYVIIALKANYLWEVDLINRGYEQIRDYQAKTPDEARALALKDTLMPHGQPHKKDDNKILQKIIIPIAVIIMLVAITLNYKISDYNRINHLKKINDEIETTKSQSERLQSMIEIQDLTIKRCAYNEVEYEHKYRWDKRVENYYKVLDSLHQAGISEVARMDNLRNRVDYLSTKLDELTSEKLKLLK